MLREQGRCLGRWAMRHWEGEPEEIVMIEISRSGSVPQARIRGMLAGIHETVRRIVKSDSRPFIGSGGEMKSDLAFYFLKHWLDERNVGVICIPENVFSAVRTSVPGPIWS